ncbi:MAG: SMC family ATPase [Methanotrichaceae archaeon]|nr:SMC family ATPase [Methanotrichaceae archaeon]
MHLNKLVLRNFKKYRRADIEFNDGLTGIVGSNGSGKSTIVEAIAWALYGNRVSTIRREFIKNARAGASDSVEVSLRLSRGRQEMTVIRTMRGKGQLAHAELLLDGRPVARGTREVDLRLEEILKISYQDFMKTFFARQKDLDNLLREGGTGKREYLLKLLGLDDIRERALQQIREDTGNLKGQEDRLQGAMAEIGDVDSRIAEISRAISSSRAALAGAKRQEEDLAGAVEQKRADLAVQEQKSHAHDLICERLNHLRASVIEKREGLRLAEDRLQEIKACRQMLEEMHPQLERRDAVRQKIEHLGPKGREHEDISRRLAANTARKEAMARMLSEGLERLNALYQDRASLADLLPEEQEFGRLQRSILQLEDLRDKHQRKMGQLSEERVRLNATSSSLEAVRNHLEKLHLAEVRLQELIPQRDECFRTEEELEHQRLLMARRKEGDELLTRIRSFQDRIDRLDRESSALKLELEGLQDLEAQEERLRSQDRDLDRLGSDLNRGLAELQGSLRVQELAAADARKNLERAERLGGEDLCPTCERPLGEQRDLLLKKYRQAIADADQEGAFIGNQVQSQREKIEDVAASRSRLRQAFDQVQSKKSRRSELLAGLRGAALQSQEAAADLQELSRRLEGLGEVQFDPLRLEKIESSLKELRRARDECQGLEVRLEELSEREKEEQSLQEDAKQLSARCDCLARELEALQYSEDRYLHMKERLAGLEASHQRFVLLSRQVESISGLEERQARLKEEAEKLAAEEGQLAEALKVLGFDRAEYESLKRERQALAKVHEQAGKIGLKLAAESEVLQRQSEASESLARLEKEIASAGEQISLLGYRTEEHRELKNRQALSEEALVTARKMLLDLHSREAVLERDLAVLQEEKSHKEKHERDLLAVERRLEVIESTRLLLNRFLDLVLIKVKNQIATTAGEILEEVSGRYSQLKIDDEFNILVEDGGEFYPISRYSGGEVDMIAVSVRVAISEYLMRFSETEGYSFLILDEVFGSQDQEHREKMIQMLRSLEDRFPQVIAISHISDVQGQFDNTLLVTEDDAGNSRVEAL